METKADTEGHEGTQGNSGDRITTRIKDGSEGPRNGLHPAFNVKGERVRKVFFRVRKDGGKTYYARVVDPKTGRETYRSSPDGSLKYAAALVAGSEKAVGRARADAYDDALGAIKRRTDGWTIGRCFEEYQKFAPGHFASLSSDSRDRGGGLVHILWAARTVFADAMDRPLSEAPRVLADYVARECAAGKKKTTVRSIATQAKSVFSRWALFEYEDMGCRVPPLKWRGIPSDDYQFSPKPLELRNRTIEAGKDELAKGSDFGLVFLLCFYCAMAAGDACRARWDWMDETGTVHYERVKTGKPADPRLPPDIAARWRELAKEHGPGEIVPRNTRKERNDFIVRQFSEWMRGLGWGKGKKSHELRKMMCSIWYSTPGVGAEWTQAWSGDSLEVLQKHYARALSEKAPAAPSV